MALISVVEGLVQIGYFPYILFSSMSGAAKAALTFYNGVQPQPLGGVGGANTPGGKLGG